MSRPGSTSAWRCPTSSSPSGRSRVVIGGGVSQAGDLLLDPIRHTVTERVNVTSIEKVQIVRAELGPNAGLIGAGVWVRTQQHRAEMILRRK